MMHLSWITGHDTETTQHNNKKLWKWGAEKVVLWTTRVRVQKKKTTNESTWLGVWYFYKSILAGVVGEK